MQFKSTQKVPETAVYIIIWLLIFIIPVLINTSNTGHFNKQILVGWARMVPFVLIFIINTVWLLPQLFFKGRTGFYLFSVVILSLLLVYIWEFVFPLLRDAINGNTMGEFDIQRPLPSGPGPGLPGKPPLGPERRLPPELSEQFPKSHLISIFNQTVIAWLVVGFNTALKVTNKWFKDEQKKRELEREHLKFELAFLQNQISPHFFMNTLNNIHAQIDIDTKEAQSSIVTLSKMMRYLL